MSATFKSKRFFVWSLTRDGNSSTSSVAPDALQASLSQESTCPNTHPTASTRLRWSGGISVDEVAEEQGILLAAYPGRRVSISSCCMWRGPSSQLAFHVEKECDFVLCPNAGACLSHTSWSKSPMCVACRSRCPFSIAPASLRRDSLDTHLAQCPHRLIACPGCGSQIFAAFDWVHIRECQSCLVPCEFCRQPMPLGALNAHELYKCERAPEAQCPRCLVFVPRAELLASHAAGACPGESVRCPLPCSRSQDRRCFEWMRREEAALHVLDAEFEALHEEQRRLQEVFVSTQLMEEDAEGVDGDAAARVFADY